MKMKSLKKILLLSTSSFLLLSCGDKEAPESEIAAMKEVISKKLTAIDQQDRKKVKQSTTLSDRAIDKKLGMAAVFDGNGTYYSSLESLTITDYHERKTLADAVVYEKASLREDSDYRMKVQYELIKKDGQWKVKKWKEGETETVVE